MSNPLGEHAVIIGGSIAGLMTARALSDFFDQVTVLERDQIEDHPAIHKSIPQGNHVHALLVGGQQVMSRLYPGFVDKLLGLGAIRARLGKDIAYLSPIGKAYSLLGGAVKEPRDLGIDFYLQSRGLLEYCVRQCTLESANVSFRSGCDVQRLIYREGSVRGVDCEQSGGVNSVAADFVVDAGGRGSRAPRWLRELGFASPEETSIGVDFSYSTAKFRLPNYGEPERMLFAPGFGPDYPKAAAIQEIEDGIRLVGLGGRFGDYPPTDDDGFLAFAKSLYTPKIYELLKGAERLSEIAPHRFPTSLRRHYERLVAFPERFLVLGDAISSFNPVYGQGMTSAALQVEALQHLLNERAEGTRQLEALAPAFFAEAAEVISAPWTLAANSDFAFPQTRGERPPGLEEGGRYFVALDALSAEDVQVQTLIMEVLSLTKPLSALSKEPLRGRVVAQMQKQSAGN